MIEKIFIYIFGALCIAVLLLVPASIILRANNYNEIGAKIENNSPYIIYNTAECGGSETDMLNKAIAYGYKISTFSEKDEQNPSVFISTGNGGGFIMPTGTRHVTTYILRK